MEFSLVLSDIRSLPSFWEKFQVFSVRIMWELFLKQLNDHLSHYSSNALPCVILGYFLRIEYLYSSIIEKNGRNYWSLGSRFID